jgi:hypothetical protein
MAYCLSLGMLGCLGGITLVNTKGHTLLWSGGMLERAGHSWRNMPNRRDFDPSLMIRISSVEIRKGQYDTNHPWGLKMWMESKVVLNGFAFPARRGSDCTCCSSLVGP